MSKFIPVRGFYPQVAEDVFLADGVVLVGDVEIEEGSSVWFNSVLRADVGPIRIGKHTNVQDGCVLHCNYQDSHCQLGNYVTIGHNVTLHGAIVEDYALVGMGSIVMDHAVVGQGAVVAAGAVVLAGTQIPPHTLYAGCPAKFIREIPEEQRNALNKNIAHNYGIYASWLQYPDQTPAEPVEWVREVKAAKGKENK